MTAKEALELAEQHRKTQHLESEPCWQCAPRKTTTYANNFLALVENVERRCRWCDGTGWYLSEWSTTRGHVWRPCGQCHATGVKS